MGSNIDRISDAPSHLFDESVAEMRGLSSIWKQPTDEELALFKEKVKAGVFIYRPKGDSVDGQPLHYNLKYPFPKMIEPDKDTGRGYVKFEPDKVDTYFGLTEGTFLDPVTGIYMVGCIGQDLKRQLYEDCDGAKWLADPDTGGLYRGFVMFEPSGRPMATLPVGQPAVSIVSGPWIYMFVFCRLMGKRAMKFGNFLSDTGKASAGIPVIDASDALCHAAVEYKEKPSQHSCEKEACFTRRMLWNR